MITVESFDTLQQAAAAMRDKTQFLGGGTLVMRNVNYGDQGFDRIVISADVDMRLIRAEAAQVRIGAGVTMKQVMDSPDLGFLAPVARSVGGPAVRNMATIGGNLFAPAPFGDFCTALLALGATVHFSDGSTQTIDDFLANRDQLRTLVAAISVPRPMGAEFRYVKITRTKPKGAAVMTIAVWLPGQGGRISQAPISQARIAFGAMGRTPLRAKSAETALEGVILDENGIRRALDTVLGGLDPQDDALASQWYRQTVAPVHLKRLLLGRGAS